MSFLAVGTLGGTIAMVEGQAGQGIKPELTADALIRSIPNFKPDFKIIAHSVLQLPGASLTLRDIVQVLEWCNQQVAACASGIVLTQGTDTLEEVAFFLDLYWNSEIPIVVTGAMRSPLSPGADGPANLHAAISVARHPSSRGRGVMIVMNDTIHSPVWVSKSHSLAVQAFESKVTGPLGFFAEGQVVFLNSIQRHKPLAPPKSLDHQVALLTSSLGSDSHLIGHAAEAGLYAGLVIAAFGAGHVSAQDADVIARHTGKLPIVVCSKANAGTTARATYGFVGSEMDLIARGALMGGWLSPPKARLLLWAIIASGISGDEQKALFKSWTSLNG